MLTNFQLRVAAAWSLVCRVLADRLPFLADEFQTIDAWYQRQHAATQTATAVAAIVIGSALLIGFFVVSTINDSIEWSTIYDDPANESLANDANSTVDRVGDGLLMGGVVVIVMFAALVLRTLRSV